jgi:hypothetical protein
MLARVACDRVVVRTTVIDDAASPPRGLSGACARAAELECWSILFSPGRRFAAEASRGAGVLSGNCLLGRTIDTARVSLRKGLRRVAGVGFVDEFECYTTALR